MKIDIFLKERDGLERTTNMIRNALDLIIDDAQITFLFSDTIKNDYLRIDDQNKQQEKDLQIVLESLLKIWELQK